MKLVLGIVFSLVVAGLIGAVGYFAWQSMQEADRVAEQNAVVAQQQAEINKREAAERKQAAAKQVAEKCVAEADQQYINNVEEAKQAGFQSQEAFNQHLKLIEDTRKAQLEVCQKQYDEAVGQSGLEVVPAN